MRILIYGFGNLGKRHMQAALELSPLAEVSIYDGFIAREKVEGEVIAFLKAVGSDEKTGRVVVVDKAEINKLEKFNVVIDATLAHDRLSRLSTLLLSLSHQPDAVLVEKLVVSGPSQLAHFSAFQSTFLSWNIYVHCPRSTWPAYCNLSNNFTQNSLDIQVDLVGTELGSNLIHFVALFDFIVSGQLATGKCRVVDSSIIWRPSTRRHAVSEGYGSISLRFGANSLNVRSSECQDADVAACRVNISSKGETLFSYHETSGELFMGGERTTEIVPFLSQSSYLYREVLNGDSALPTLLTSLKHHELVFECFQQSKLSGAVT